MRRLLLFLPLLLLAGCYPYYPYYGSYYGYPGLYAQSYPPGYYVNRPPPPGYGGPPPQYRSGPPPGQPPSSQAYNTENCGTPDEPKACPPMPRVPLPYYPANRQ